MRRKERLPYDDFVPFAPDGPGEQIKVHHCRPGKDNDRLYIRRNEDGSIVANCFHCGLSGYRSDKWAAKRLHKRSKGRDGSTSRKRLTLPSDFTTDWTEWHPHARAWVRRYGIESDELVSNSVGYSESLGSVVLPVFGEAGNLVSYQFRPVVRRTSEKARKGTDTNGSRTPPKYVSRCQQGRKGGIDVFVARPSWTGRTVSDERPSTCVVTEDVLSSIKVSRVPGCVGVAIMGSHVKQEQALKIAKLADNVAVFLDNDNAQVRNNQRKAAKLLGPLVSRNVRVIEADKDPKEHTESELRELLGK